MSIPAFRRWASPLLLNLSLLLAGAVFLSACASAPEESSAPTVTQADGSQAVRVLVKNGYHPSHIQALAGKPLKIEFYRDEAPGTHSCVQDLSIPSESVAMPLPAGESRTVVIKPHPAGDEVAFECGMRMQRGRISFQ